MVTTQHPGSSAPPRGPRRVPAWRRGPAAVVWLIAGGCWGVTVAVSLVAGGGYGHHDAVLEGSGTPLPLAVFAAAWLVMIGAMMLPTTIPLVELFWVVSARHPRPATARAALLVPYFAVWLGFAGVALAADAAVHALVDAWAWLGAREGLVLGATLVLAGAFQFTDLKAACLTACRSPLSMLWEHYDRTPRSAWALGTRHALSCLGCCWALMLVMFAVGSGALTWMLLLTAVMVAEKTASWGHRMVTPAAVVLIVAGLAHATAALAAPLT